VSAAEFSAVKDVGFAFARARSRLVEMQTPQYLDAHKKARGRRRIERVAMEDQKGGGLRC
jgi:hypothetical protein